MSICQREAMQAGGAYPRSCPTCELGGPCAKGIKPVPPRNLEINAWTGAETEVSPLAYVKAECIGGPLDGESPVVDARGSTVRFPDVRTLSHFVYDVVRLPGGKVELHWEFAP